MTTDVVELDVSFDDSPLPEVIDESTIGTDPDVDSFDVVDVCFHKPADVKLDLQLYEVPNAPGVRVRNVNQSALAVMDGILQVGCVHVVDLHPNEGSEGSG